MQNLSHSTAPVTATPSNERVGQPDLPLWSAGAGLLATAFGLAAMAAPIGVAVSTAIGASAATVGLARWRAAEEFGPSIAIDRALQGVLVGALVWLAIVGAAMAGALSPLAMVPFALALLVIMAVLETAAAVGAIMLVGRGRGAHGGAIVAAILIDNRAFGCFGTLDPLSVSSDLIDGH